jgi:hypothetical protein
MGKRVRLKVRDAGGSHTRDAADKTLIAAYRGEEYISEIVGDAVIIRAIIYSESKGVQKTWVASYNATKDFRYVAERSGEDLIVYAIKSDGSAVGSLTTSDSMVRDSLKSIRDNKKRMDDVNKVASDFWNEQRKAQDTNFK